MARQFFQKVLRYKWIVSAIYIILTIPAAFYAAQVKTDNSVDSLIVPDGDGREIFEQFREVFGSDEFILIGLEGKDIYSKEFLSEAEEIERRLEKLELVSRTRSLISFFRQVNPLFNAHDEKWREKFKKFTVSTPFFNYQGLIAPDRMLTIILQLKVKDTDERRKVVPLINDVLRPFEEKKASPFRIIRKVGQPIMIYELDASTMEIASKYMPIYIILAMLLVIFLYRSFKGLLTIFITIGLSLAYAIGIIHASGSVLTMISSVLPMMIIVVTIETVVHIYSGYVRPPEGVDIHDHLVNVLVHKLQACWLSVLTTTVGFGSFAFSSVVPVRELGVFVAFSLVISFFMSFTLFPILLDILKPPTGRNVKTIGLQMLDPILGGIPTYTYWWRKTLVLGMTILGAIGLQSLFQIEVETNSLNYLPRNNQLYQDTMYVENNLIGLMQMELMLEGEKGKFATPDALRKMQEFERQIDSSPDVQSVLSASTMIKMANFIENGKDSYPVSNFSVSKYILALSQQDMFGSFVSDKFDKYRISAVTNGVDNTIFDGLSRSIDRMWDNFIKKNPEFKDVKVNKTGLALLTSKIGGYLLSTLLSSFGFTLLIVFVIFFFQIKRLSYAILAMLPSLFAIVLMYMAMIWTGHKLDIASIMMAAIVLGLSVDATIHFFQHYMEKQKSGASVEECLRYSLIITGRAIIVAFIVIFSGFMVFAFSNFPPLKQFGLFTAIALLFALIGTVIYLPACLWLMSPKEKPAHLSRQNYSMFSVLPPKPPAIDTKNIEE